MQTLTDKQLGNFLAKLGKYRVVRAQEAALDGPSDGISGALLLAIGLRETHLENVEGGAKLVDGVWVKEDDPKRMDVGWLQISRKWHSEALRRMPGVKAGTWTPLVAGKSAADGGYCPRFEDSLQYTIAALREGQAYAEDHFISERVRFCIAAHNAGNGGAWSGWRDGDMDKYTASGDYSAWVLKTRTQVNSWLHDHPNWKTSS